MSAIVISPSNQAHINEVVARFMAYMGMAIFWRVFMVLYRVFVIVTIVWLMNVINSRQSDFSVANAAIFAMWTWVKSTASHWWNTLPAVYFVGLQVYFTSHALFRFLLDVQFACRHKSVYLWHLMQRKAGNTGVNHGGGGGNVNTSSEILSVPTTHLDASRLSPFVAPGVVDHVKAKAAQAADYKRRIAEYKPGNTAASWWQMVWGLFTSTNRDIVDVRHNVLQEKEHEANAAAAAAAASSSVASHVEMKQSFTSNPLNKSATNAIKHKPSKSHHHIAVESDNLPYAAINSTMTEDDGYRTKGPLVSLPRYERPSAYRYHASRHSKSHSPRHEQ